MSEPIKVEVFRFHDDNAYAKPSTQESLSNVSEFSLSDKMLLLGL